MPTYNIDIGARFGHAFGFAYKNIAGRAGVGYNGRFIYGNVEAYSAEEGDFDYIKIKGSSFELQFGDMPFLHGNYGVLSGVLEGKQNSGNDIFAPPPMLSFRRGKSLKVTEIDGADSEFVECFGLKQWEIKMQGIVVDMAEHQYPSYQVSKLNELFELNEILEVSGQMFEEKKIRSIYIKDIEISGVEGYTDTQKYTISARSIKPVEFSLLNQV